MWRWLLVLIGLLVVARVVWANQNLLPGYGIVDEVDSSENLLPGYGIVNETVAEEAAARRIFLVQ